ncbi:MAG: HAMP domain-containing sensor histidine kinase [Blautia sp.]|jgi:signal transduction histidine kinase
MKPSLLAKLFAAYLIFGFVGFFFTATFGSSHVESQLEQMKSSDLYHAATNLAMDTDIRYTNSFNAESVYKVLHTVADFEDADIWMMNSTGGIIMDTSATAQLLDPIPVQGFDPTAWGTSYYRTGNFYGYFHEDKISVMAPITVNMAPKGYIIIHYPMQKLHQEREQILSTIYWIFLFFFLVSLLILAVFYVTVHRPLKKITRGVDEFSAGHLDYNIPVSTDDELGYLAMTLNYMSDQFNKTGEYQRNFISNVSHDFRSPLTSIKGYVEAIEDGTIPPEMQGKYLKIVSFEAERLEKLTRSLLTLNDLDVKTRMMNMRSFDINNVIKNTAASFEGTCREKKISISLILCGEELYVYADMEQIQQVLYNLLDNAIKFSSHNSTITIENTEKGGKVFVSVKDQGCGIPKDKLPKIWDRFYKSDASRGKDRKGTGLGLSIVKEIIAAHGQNINVISTENAGTEFIFTLEKPKKEV